MANCNTNTLVMGRPSNSSSGGSCSAGFVTTTPVGAGTSTCNDLGPVSCPKNIGQRRNRERVREQLKDYVLLMLGAPVLDIELDEQQLDLAVDQALKIYEEWAPRDFYDYHTFFTTPGKSVYQMPPDIGLIRNVFYKEEGSFAFQASDLDGALPIEYFYPGGSYASIQGGLIDPIQPIWGRAGEWHLYKQYEQTFSRLSSNLGGWEWVGDRDCIKLYPTPCRCSKVIVHHLQKCKDWKEVEEAMQDGALSYSKIIVGRIRSKYTNIPGPQGGVQLDGREILAEGREELKEWRENLITRYGELPFISLD